MDVDRAAKNAAQGKPRIELQWSHVLMDVDSRQSLPFATPKTKASMEPRPDGRG